MVARGGAVALALLAGFAWADDQDLGRIEEVDRQGRELELERGQVLKLDKRSEIFRNGGPVSVDQLQEGDAVRASFDAEGKVRRVEAVSSDELEPSKEGWEAPKNMSQCLPGANGAC